MNPKAFARLMLFFPHVLLGILWLRDVNWALFISIFAFIPYTILSIGLLIWSRNKTFARIKNTYIYHSPVWLAFTAAVVYLIIIIFMIGYLLIAASTEKDVITDSIIFLIVAGSVSILASLIIGYFCAGIFLLLYKVLQRIGLIQDEMNYCIQETES
jgi:hypothetical protein